MSERERERETDRERERDTSMEECGRTWEVGSLFYNI